MRPSDGATVPWSDLEFPGRRPKRAGAGQYPFCPPGGYASSRLRGWNPRRPVSELLALFLDDFLKQNGYHAIGDAVTDTTETAALQGAGRAEIATPRAAANSPAERGQA